MNKKQQSSYLNQMSQDLSTELNTQQIIDFSFSEKKQEKEQKKRKKSKEQLVIEEEYEDFEDELQINNKRKSVKKKEQYNSLGKYGEKLLKEMQFRNSHNIPAFKLATNQYKIKSQMDVGQSQSPINPYKQKKQFIFQNNTNQQTLLQQEKKEDYNFLKKKKKLNFDRKKAQSQLKTKYYNENVDQNQQINDRYQNNKLKLENKYEQTKTRNRRPESVQGIKKKINYIQSEIKNETQSYNEQIKKDLERKQIMKKKLQLNLDNQRKSINQVFIQQSNKAKNDYLQALKNLKNQTNNQQLLDEDEQIPSKRRDKNKQKTEKIIKRITGQRNILNGEIDTQTKDQTEQKRENETNLYSQYTKKNYLSSLGYSKQESEKYSQDQFLRVFDEHLKAYNKNSFEKQLPQFYYSTNTENSKFKGKTHLSTPHSAVSKNHYYNSDLFKIQSNEQSKKNHLSHRYMKPMAPQEYQDNFSKQKSIVNSRLQEINEKYKNNQDEDERRQSFYEQNQDLFKMLQSSNKQNKRESKNTVNIKMQEKSKQRESIEDGSIRLQYLRKLKEKNKTNRFNENFESEYQLSINPNFFYKKLKKSNENNENQSYFSKQNINSQKSTDPYSGSVNILQKSQKQKKLTQDALSMLSENKKMQITIDKKHHEQEQSKELNSNIAGSQFKRSIVIGKDQHLLNSQYDKLSNKSTALSSTLINQNLNIQEETLRLQLYQKLLEMPTEQIEKLLEFFEQQDQQRRNENGESDQVQQQIGTPSNQMNRVELISHLTDQLIQNFY